MDIVAPASKADYLARLGGVLTDAARYGDVESLCEQVPDGARYL